MGVIMLLSKKNVFLFTFLLLALSVSAVTLFEIKDESGNPVLIVDSEGLTVMTWDYSSGSKALGDTLMTISSKSIKAHIRGSGKALSRSFSVTTASSKGSTNVFDVNTASATLREGSGTEYSVFSPENIFLGSEAGKSITDGKYNIFLGNRSGYTTQGTYTPQYPDVGSKNFFAGFESGFSNIDGRHNVYIGYKSGYSNEQGSNSVFIGDQSGMNTTESFNVFIGDQSGKSNTGGFFNVFLGGNSGIINDQGSSNTFIGYSAGYSNKNGSHNTALGMQAGSKYGGTGNTSVGVNAGYSGGFEIQTDNNTNIGYSAGYGNKGGGNVFLGAYAGSKGSWIGEFISNRLMISNEFNVSKPLIQGLFPNNSIYLNADSVKVGGLVSGSGNAVYRNATTGFLVSSSSDLRLKENISPIKNGLDKVSKLQGVNFSWKSDEDHENKIGFIAQEVEKVLPEVVFTNEADGYKGINYAEITAVLVEAVKELQSENRELKKRVSEIERLRAEMDVLREQITGYAAK
jgi:hypothetical protein